ncbi:uncharacterized protein EV422DRAFT_572231 [Fimicolochytrium jonesii]|uniref:uncharacterized protein n=1 Tax=Fimicolochytrium jonesii TaxID=1396493 RepID=UPI0022FE506E|nr:uncharacterized protein EV422DRAFT_572231 [Fimicolochytrium jonesii]KAI8816014.1 hypothetical protein EV422DRAFT_572231 [Fimicolochytrium jonesii]
MPFTTFFTTLLPDPPPPSSRPSSAQKRRRTSRFSSDDDHDDNGIPSSSNPTYRIRTQWNDDLTSTTDLTASSTVVCNLGVTDGITVWTRAITASDLTSCRPEDISPPDHLAATRTALCGISTFYKTQRLNLNITTRPASSFTAEADLTWELLLDGGISFSLGSLPLTPLTPDQSRYTWLAWIDELIHLRTSTLTSTDALTRKVDSLRRQREEVLAEHEEWIKVNRVAVERVIYKKFKEVLNGKKKKIRELSRANKALAREAQKAEEALRLLAAGNRGGNANALSTDGLATAPVSDDNETGISDADETQSPPRRTASSSSTTHKRRSPSPPPPPRASTANHPKPPAPPQPTSSTLTQPLTHGKSIFTNSSDDENAESSDADGPPALLGHLGLSAVSKSAMRRRSEGGRGGAMGAGVGRKGANASNGNGKQTTRTPSGSGASTPVRRTRSRGGAGSLDDL